MIKYPRINVNINLKNCFIKAILIYFRNENKISTGSISFMEAPVTSNDTRSCLLLMNTCEISWNPSRLKINLERAYIKENETNGLVPWRDIQTTQ